ncbi:hypothetical protein MNB_SUP05-9-944 [hydrothermal vent metagenome]|uniref:Uncharacterized protein n=1 Tax=hydrothermal vent metagenome TaxID=652676 RepID=A0A1W1DU89_9ZZZZ
MSVSLSSIVGVFVGVFDGALLTTTAAGLTIVVSAPSMGNTMVVVFSSGG